MLFARRISQYAATLSYLETKNHAARLLSDVDHTTGASIQDICELSALAAVGATTQSIKLLITRGQAISLLSLLICKRTTRAYTYSGLRIWICLCLCMCCVMQKSSSARLLTILFLFLCLRYCQWSVSGLDLAMPGHAREPRSKESILITRTWSSTDGHCRHEHSSSGKSGSPSYRLVLMNYTVVDFHTLYLDHQTYLKKREIIETRCGFLIWAAVAVRHL